MTIDMAPRMNPSTLTAPTSVLMDKAATTSAIYARGPQPFGWWCAIFAPRDAETSWASDAVAPLRSLSDSGGNDGA